MSLLVTSERTSVFRVKYSDLLGYPKVNKDCGEENDEHTIFPWEVL
jgi:hypothetical protein